MSSPDLPFELQLTLRPGTVYYFKHRAVYSDEPHYFAVINEDPRSDHVLLMAIASSQLDRVKQRRKQFPPETLVIIDESEYADFTKPTIIDCNQIFELSRAELIQKLAAKELRSHQDLPKDILHKIWQGAHRSPRVDEAHKLLLPPFS